MEAIEHRTYCLQGKEEYIFRPTLFPTTKRMPVHDRKKI